MESTVDQLRADLAEMRTAMERQQARIDTLESDAPKPPDGPLRSRRQLLKLAGATLAGAAGAAALKVVPASAADGNTITVGGSFTGTLATSLDITGGNGFIGTAESDGMVGVMGLANGLNAWGIQGNAFNTGGVGGSFYGPAAPIHLTPDVAGPPSSASPRRVGDLYLDVNGTVWTCVAAGNPGTFVPVTYGGAGISEFWTTSNTQYSLANSDGKTWVDLDTSGGLAYSITPKFNALAIASVSIDLWTANSGFNQDIGIFLSGGGFGAGRIVAWKESGGSAGTFSPNAAFVETTQSLAKGTTYVFKVRWKTNQPAPGATIFAGAGPLPAGSLGGGVAGEISPSRLAIRLTVA